MSSTQIGTDLITEDRVELGGVMTRTLTLEGTGEPIVLVHGFADSADTWRSLLYELSLDGRPAIALDLGGFGAADDVDRRRALLPQWDRMIDDCVELAHGLGGATAGGSIQIAGNSLGGCLAIRAAQRPELGISGAIPIAPAGLEMARWIGVIESQKLLRVLFAAPIPVPEGVVKEVVGRAFANLAFSSPSIAPPEAISRFASHMPTTRRASAILDLGRLMRAELEAEPFELEKISCAMLLVWGEKDRLVYTGGAERVLRTVPYSDMEIIRGCGHCPQLEMPRRLAKMIAAFPESYEHPE